MSGDLLRDPFGCPWFVKRIFFVQFLRKNIVYKQSNKIYICLFSFNSISE